VHFRPNIGFHARNLQRNAAFATLKRLKKYCSRSIGSLFLVSPTLSRYNREHGAARQGRVNDNAMGAIEGENPTPRDVPPHDYARPSLDKVRLGGLVDMVSNIGFYESAATLLSGELRVPAKAK
jgi:hypothetical protein